MEEIKHSRCPHRAAITTAGLLFACVAAAQPPRTFTIQERFGVSHPQQIIDFDLDPPIAGTDLHVVGSDGPVAFQIIEDGAKLGLRTDLPAGETRAWQLLSGPVPEQPDTAAVSVIERENVYEIVNESIGIRIPRVPEQFDPVPAPIQGLRYPDGTWTATKFNPLSLTGDCTGMEVTFLERGPLTVVARITYRTHRPALTYGTTQYAEGGPGTYSVTITIQAGQPSILFEEESDTDLNYRLDVNHGLRANRARYQGHHARSPELGREADGRQYRMWHQRSNMDAFVDLSFDVSRAYRPMAHWDPWVYNSGWYWQLYRDGVEHGNLFGIFAGRASRVLGPGNSGVAVHTAPAGVADLDSTLDRDGNLHVVWETDNELWYIRFDGEQRPGTPVRIAEDAHRPDLFVNDTGHVLITAYRPRTKDFILITVDGDTIRSAPIELADAGTVRLLGRRIYLAHSGDTHFLFAHGTHDGHTGGLLFSRATGEPAWTFRDLLPLHADTEFHARQPAVASLPDGTVTLAYTNPGGWIDKAVILPGELTFDKSRRPLYGSTLNHLVFGTAVDPRTGDLFVANNLGEMAYLTADDDASVLQVRVPVQHRRSGPNRRTLATAPDGSALLVQLNWSADPFPSLFRRGHDGWEPFDAANNLRLAAAQAHFHQPSGRFLLVGREDGQLALHAWQPGADMTRLAQLPDTERQSTGITLSIRRLKPTQQADLLVRFQWGLFLGRVEEDLGPPDQPQAIARQMNLHGGFNLNKVHRYQLDYPDPPRGHGALFMSTDAMEAIHTRLREDPEGPHGSGYYAYLYRAEPYARPLVDFWRNNDAAEARRLAGQVADTARDILDRLVNGNGIYDFGIHYWHGAGRMTGQALWADQLLATEHLSDDDRAAMKAAVALFGYVLWDNDFVPLQPQAKLNLGNPNMPVMQRNARSALALQLAGHPDMADPVRQVVDQARLDLADTVNAYGAHIGSAHYIGASMYPLLNTFQQLQTAGVYDGFAHEERLSAFAEFYLQLLTPPEIRFGGWRKLVPIGDGSTESSMMFGQMATGFATGHPELSRRLMGAWTANHRRHGSFQGSSLLKIDERLPESDFPLGDATFPGWFSVLRHGWGTPDETAAWVVNGEWYIDHRHADQGSVVLYALGAPLSTDWGPIYYPRAAGGIMHNMVWPADAIGHPWDAPNPPLDAGHWRHWLNSTQDHFISFTHGARAVSRFHHRDRLASLLVRRRPRTAHAGGLFRRAGGRRGLAHRGRPGGGEPSRRRGRNRPAR